MSDSLKILGQAAPGATTLTTLYTVPIGTTATVSTLIACNTGKKKEKIRVSVAVNGAVDTIAQYISYDQDVLANSSFPITIGITLNTGDLIRVYSLYGGISFNAFGVEVT